MDEKEALRQEIKTLLAGPIPQRVRCGNASIAATYKEQAKKICAVAASQKSNLCALRSALAQLKSFQD